jgi:2-dehydro-3-deoxygluconokinase
MNQLITIGETMLSLVPKEQTPLRYGPDLGMHIAGAESNTAIGVQKLGHSAAHITRVGDDSFGRYLLRMLRAEGVDTSYVKVDQEYPTGIMFKEFLPGNKTSIQYYRSNSAASHLSTSDIPEEAISQAEIIHLTGITPILSESCRQMIFHILEIAVASHSAISFDPNIRKKLWKNCDYRPLMKEIITKSSYVLIGLDEALALYDTDNIQRLSKLIFSSGKLQSLAIKNGSGGAWVCNLDRQLFIPPVSCHCIDSVGAGDAFNAGFLAGILEGKPLEVCGTIGAVSGALVTETMGDIEGMVDERDVHNALNHIDIAYR